MCPHDNGEDELDHMSFLSPDEDLYRNFFCIFPSIDFVVSLVYAGSTEIMFHIGDSITMSKGRMVLI